MTPDSPNTPHEGEPSQKMSTVQLQHVVPANQPKLNELVITGAILWKALAVYGLIFGAVAGAQWAQLWKTTDKADAALIQVARIDEKVSAMRTEMEQRFAAAEKRADERHQELRALLAPKDKRP